MPAKAPIGGIVSQVNGQFYNGGEFVPETGLYCGKGKNRVAKPEFDAMAMAAASNGYSLEYNEKFDNFRVLTANGNCYVSARQLKTLKQFTTVFG